MAAFLLQMPGTGYVSIADYMNANQGTLDRERADLQNYTGKEYGDAQSSADDLIKSAVPGSGDYTQMSGYAPVVDKINTAQQDQTGLQTYGGVADLINRIYGGQKDAADFDAGLLGPQQQNAQKSNLLDYLNGTLAFNTRDIPPQNTSGSSGSRHNKPHGELPGPAPDPLPWPRDPNEEVPGSTDNSIYGGGGG